MYKDLDETIRKICNCNECKQADTCVHRDSFRRYPYEYGGTSSCKNLKKAGLQ